MSFSFSKMQALGNDFVVIDCVTQPLSVTKKLIQSLSDRHYGVGCDQVLLITPAKNNAADFGYRIFNADGGEVFQCGNGARCVGLFVRDKKLSDKKIITLETARGLIRVTALENNIVQADIATPNFDPRSLPFVTTEEKAPFHLTILNREIMCNVVSVGNPHCVIENKNYSEAEMITIGEAFNASAFFPEGINVGFVQYDSADAIHLRVYERGAGMTKACGSGACAAVAIGKKHHHLSSHVFVHQIGGALEVIWESSDQMIQLRGEAGFVFDGTWT